MRFFVVTLGLVALLVACSSEPTTTTLGRVDSGADADVYDAEISDTGADGGTDSDDGGTAYTTDSAFRCCLPGAGKACCKGQEDRCFEYAGCFKENEAFDRKIPCSRCCDGLVYIDIDEPTEVDGGGVVCQAKFPGGSKVCTHCGDGTCGLGENYCNCPADCPKPDGG